jgi:hypothetical protein
MLHYRFYLMVGTKIMRGEDVTCTDDRAANREAERRLQTGDPAYDAIEVWQGVRPVCRHERAALPGCR